MVLGEELVGAGELLADIVRFLEEHLQTDAVQIGMRGGLISLSLLSSCDDHLEAL